MTGSTKEALVNINNHCEPSCLKPLYSKGIVLLDLERLLLQLTSSVRIVIPVAWKRAFGKASRSKFVSQNNLVTSSSEEGGAHKRISEYEIVDDQCIGRIYKRQEKALNWLTINSDSSS